MAQVIKHWRIWFVISLILITGAGFYILSRPEESQPYQGVELSDAAPDFRLIDQNGDPISLSNFRDKVVVLTFMDSQCEDVCPLTSAHLIQAYEGLDQSEAAQVVFLAVNVNIDANEVTDVSLATKNWRLDQIPNWHFLTGSVEELTSVWSEYGVAVNSQSLGEIMHTPGVFLIDRVGQKRWYISTPYSNEGNAEWTLPLSELLVRHLQKLLNEGPS